MQNETVLLVTTLELAPVGHFQTLIDNGEQPEMIWIIRGKDNKGATISFKRPVSFDSNGYPKPLPVCAMSRDCVGSFVPSGLKTAELKKDDDGLPLFVDGDCVTAQALPEGWKPWNVTVTLVPHMRGAICVATGLVVTPQKGEGYFNGVADSARFEVKAMCWDDDPDASEKAISAYSHFKRRFNRSGALKRLKEQAEIAKSAV
jgi:hypothetical protein